MHVKLWLILLICGIIGITSCEEYFYPLTPDAAQSNNGANGGNGTEPENPDEDTSMGIQLVWE